MMKYYIHLYTTYLAYISNIFPPSRANYYIFFPFNLNIMQTFKNRATDSKYP